MKKRKELNALIGLGPGDGRGRSRRSRRAWKGASGHRLLRTEPPASGSASSSEDEDDDDDDDDEDERGGGGGGGGARARFARGDYFRCCKVCYPLCAFVLLAACVVACVGLVWMQVALKEDLDALKEQFRILESNQKSSFQEIPKLNEELLHKQKQLEKIESGDLGLSKIWINITEMAKQIALLTSTVNHLKANLKSASDLISLPATVEGLQKSVASIGSTLNSVRLAVEAVQKTVDEHKNTIETLRSDMKEDSPDSQASQLREKLQLITALTGKPEASRPPEEASEEEKRQSAQPKPSTLPKFSRRSLGNQVETAAHLRPISSPADLLDLFRRMGQGPEGQLTYQDLWDLLGSAAPSAQSMAKFDTDRDGRYSLSELRLALGLEHTEQN
ncbi:EF-hand calcium-binding domain-containing protein 14 isoform X5 [Dromiciops gliroides]|uniref:EF-hand calcium-binding domain-containing protein 14 isoform X5 n=1 Tax=Dromiciops gliroides TaxID=33562 RepID=UPI001CC4B1CC|nr:EF-hand calcium-binding domain-containing protein 14 isoform X5 [Dromiciops gliroides]